MNCRWVRHKLPEYLEGILHISLQERIARHLETCERCAREREALARLQSLLSDDPIPTPSGTFWEEQFWAIRRARRSAPPLRRSRQHLRWAWVPVALVLALWLGHRTLRRPHLEEVWPPWGLQHVYNLDDIEREAAEFAVEEGWSWMITELWGDEGIMEGAEEVLTGEVESNRSLRNLLDELTDDEMEHLIEQLEAMTWG